MEGFVCLRLVMSSDGQSLQYPDLNTKLIVTIFSESQFLSRHESDSISVVHVSAVVEVCFPRCSCSV